MNTDNSFDPTARSNSSLKLVSFIPFKNNENKCNYCGKEYSKTIKFGQKYCKDCLFRYIQYSNNTYLDVHITTNNTTQCTEHKATRNNFHTTNIREWCVHCSEILYFKQVVTEDCNDYSSVNCDHIIENAHCKRCEYKRLFVHDQGCYQISYGWTKSTLTEERILILYLPWWDNYAQCAICHHELKYAHQKSEFYYQKWCSDCYVIYSGCEHCLTTNFIFGITDQSQCKKCKKISPIAIDITTISSGNNDIDKYLFSRISKNNSNHLIYLIDNYKNNHKSLSRFNVYMFIKSHYRLRRQETKWIPHTQIKNSEKIAEGGFSIISKATWSHGNDIDVAVKRLNDSQKVIKYFLNELKSFCELKLSAFVIECYGITQDPVTKEYMLIMAYANGGNLHDYLRKNFKNITWCEKLNILRRISSGLKSIHESNFIHRDLHSGNILFSKFSSFSDQQDQRWQIGDLGLSQHAINNDSNSEIYGVMPYIAPEIFMYIGTNKFSKESDIYSFGMIMWELTTGCKPFADFEHDVVLIFKILDGKRPKITQDTPECFASLMKKCWDSNPLKRPTIDEINTCFFIWSESAIPFKEAEQIRLNLIQSQELGPEISEKPHPKTRYTSKVISSSICKSVNPLSTIPPDMKQEYITKEHELDINDTRSLSVQNINSAGINSSRKRDIEKTETQNDRKRVKITDVYCQ
ncbi:hypothetical protein RclHR1_10290005 [Rhizophagus clarus]|uniref:Kinase-like domain-containing protein n=1 Tax=Rhizophagus clarus TaxID=94130 RepID=A0A2Z6Q163_9GLOM|nr:hypothetical protein RclHR1_10290005 [Rhizophagus clarus]GES95395.1 kinase-like domain-containing protein [Rhizophagus clarus]